MAHKASTELMIERFNRSVESMKKPREKQRISCLLIPTLVECDAEKGLFSLAYHTEYWMANAISVVHGGFTSFFLDSAMGIAAYCASGNSVPSLNLNINFARPVPLDSDIIVRTHLVVLGKTSAQLTAEVFLPENPDRILASGTGVYYTGGFTLKKESAGEQK